MLSIIAFDLNFIADFLFCSFDSNFLNSFFSLHFDSFYSYFYFVCITTSMYSLCMIKKINIPKVKNISTDKHIRMDGFGWMENWL